MANKRQAPEFVVYMAVNQITGDRYIGASSNFLVRKRDHLHWAMKGSDGCKKFYRSIRKYGPGSFEWVILESSKSKKAMFKAEINFIARLKPELNLTRGGEGIVGWKRTKAWRKSVSAAQKGNPVSKACTDAYYKAGLAKFFRSVVCLNDGKFFDNISQAAKFYGISENGVRGVANGNTCFIKGYSFVETPGPLPEDQRASLLEGMHARIKASQLKSKDWKRRKVLCVDDGKEYPQASVAAEVYGVLTADVRRRCLNKNSTKTSLTFRFLN